MSLFSKLRRNSIAGDRYASHASSYVSSNSTRRRERHERHERQRFGSGGLVPSVSVESIPYLPSETTRGASSEVSLRSEYTHLDNDTSRYPKLSASASGAPENVLQKRRADAYNEIETNRRMVGSQIAPMLAVGTSPIMWDIRDSPAHMRQYRNTSRSDDLTASALSTQSQYLCLVSYDFPWTIAISTNDGHPLTILDVVEALYESLHKEVRRSEWALAADVQRYIIQKANKGRRRSAAALSIKRVDWLGSKCMFRGLERDEDLTRKRMMPGDNPSEMWAVRFGSMH